MRTLLLVLGMSVASISGGERGVVYVLAREDVHELRIYRPEHGDQLLLQSEGPPKNAFWDESFDNLFYRVNSTVFRMPWVVGAKSEVVFNDAPDADDLWIDSSTGRWRAYEVYFPGVGYRARVYEHRSEDGWVVLADEKTEGCEAGDGSLCGREVRNLRTGRRGAFFSELQTSMRIASQLEKRGLEFDFRHEGETHFLPSMEVDGVGVELRLQFGDTLHGTAPVHWVDRARGSAKEIFPQGSRGCRRQVSLDEHADWLLVTGEYTGKCARVIALSDGAIVWESPAGSSLAAWVPVPRGD